MAINIFYSTSVRATSTSQDALNDLATLWDWNNIVYSETTPSNVEQLWVSDKIYISLSGSYIAVNHTNGVTHAFNSVSTTYNIIQGDALLFLVNSASSHAPYFCVTKTTDPNGIRSMGVITSTQSTNDNAYCFSDNITSISKYYNGIMVNSDSRINTLLVPIYSITGDEVYDSAYFPLLKKSIDNGKVVINNRHYYLAEAIAIEYEL